MKEIIRVILMQRQQNRPLRVCPEHPVQAEEGDQAVLNCFLPWHRLLLGRPEYHYSWAPGVPGARQVTSLAPKHYEIQY